MKKPPNILLIMTDQQRADSIAALGNPIIKTPHLDRLVREGTAFTRAYSPSPVCVSARCSLVTGMPPHATGVVDNSPERCDMPSFMERAAGLGYQTQGVGKMHFSPDLQRLWGFQARDFNEEGIGQDDFRTHLKKNGFDWVDDTYGVRGEQYYLPQPSQLPAHLHGSTWTADRSIDFLKNRDTTRPFLLFSSFIKPHPPFESPTPWNKLYRSMQMPKPYIPENYEDYWVRINRVQNRYKYRDRATHDDLLQRTTTAAYYGCVSFVDYNVGRIFETLGDEMDNTLILYFTDHGEMLGDYGCVGKRCMLEPSVRIPLLARLPGVFDAGHRAETAATLLDIFPTVLTAAGDPTPCVSPEGRPLQELACETPGERIVMSQFQHGWIGNYMASNSHWKYIYSAADKKEFLFEIDDSLQEKTNRIADPTCADILARLRGELLHSLAGDKAATLDGQWLNYENVPPFTDDPDYGLLMQDVDAQALQRQIDDLGPGYARKVSMPDSEAYRLIIEHQG